MIITRNWIRKSFGTVNMSGQFYIYFSHIMGIHFTEKLPKGSYVWAVPLQTNYNILRKSVERWIRLHAKFSFNVMVDWHREGTLNNSTLWTFANGLFLQYGARYICLHLDLVDTTFYFVVADIFKDIFNQVIEWNIDQPSIINEVAPYA